MNDKDWIELRKGNDVIHVRKDSLQEEHWKKKGYEPAAASSKPK